MSQKQVSCDIPFERKIGGKKILERSIKSGSCRTLLNNVIKVSFSLHLKKDPVKTTHI